MPTTTKKAPAITGSAAIAQQISDTNAVIEEIRRGQQQLNDQLSEAEANLNAQQAALAEVREAEATAAAEAELSEDLKALKKKAQAVNKAARALAELWPEFKENYQRHLNALPAEQQGAYYGLGGRNFSPSTLPYIEAEPGAERIKITTLSNAPK